MKLWGGRFRGGPDQEAWNLNASLPVDRRLALQDLRGSQAWARALFRAGVLSEDEHQQIQAGLERIAGELEQDKFQFQPTDEDIHTAVERRLGEITGPAAGKLHTGRSRNDQVATDFRLWMLDNLPALQEALSGLQQVLVERAERDLEVLLPGYTHLQRAQPVLLSHWWLSHFWPLQRDRERLMNLRDRTAVLPLGAGALAGTPFPIDRHALAEDLAFDRPAPNSIDAVSDRDFAAEFLFCAALTGVHISRLAEDVVLYSSAEFGYFELDDAYASGSSLMPQKKNPDVFELARGKAGGLIGGLTGLLATLKGLPSAYDKDLQEDKQVVFQAFDTLMALAPVLAGAIETLEVDGEKTRAAIDAGMFATDLADFLVRRGMAFREAHELVGRVVQQAAGQDKSLDALSLAEFHALHPAFGAYLSRDDLESLFDAEASVSRRVAFGGTAPEAVRRQIAQARELV